MSNEELTRVFNRRIWKPLQDKIDLERDVGHKFEVNYAAVKTLKGAVKKLISKIISENIICIKHDYLVYV